MRNLLTHLKEWVIGRQGLLESRARRHPVGRHPTGKKRVQVGRNRIVAGQVDGSDRFRHLGSSQVRILGALSKEVILQLLTGADWRLVGQACQTCLIVCRQILKQERIKVRIRQEAWSHVGARQRGRATLAISHGKIV